MHVLAALCLSLTVLALPLSAGQAFAAEPSSDEATQKWPTDHAVRTGMLAIRDLVRTNHSLITHRRMPPDHAQRFARAIQEEADKILATSRIPGTAKASLAQLLAQVTAGVEAVAHPDKGVAPMDGLIRVDEALARYPKEFDHYGWAPAQSLE